MEQVVARYSNRADLLLSVVMSALVAFAGWALIADVSLFVAATAAADDRPLVGAITTTANAVRRRAADLPVWDGAASGDELRLRDQVFTDSGATAILALVGGTTLELGENTLVAMETTEERSVLNVIKGSVRARVAASAPPLLVKVAGARGTKSSPGQTAVAAATLISSGPKADVSVSVTDAAPAVVTVWSGNSLVGDQPLAEQQTLAIGATVATPTRVAVRLVSPEHGARLSPKQQATLQWRRDAVAAMDANDDVVRVEIATDTGFQSSVIAATASQSFAVPTLAPGTYYWRVIPLNDSDAAAEVRRLVIDAPAIPQLLAPAPGQTLTGNAPDGSPSTASTTVPVDMLWHAAPDAGTTTIEVARDDAFTDKVLSRRIDATSLRLSLAPGGYHWRVGGRDGWSPAASFRLESVTPASPAADVSKPAAPKLKAPTLPKQLKILLPSRRSDSLLWRSLAVVSDLLETTAQAADADADNVIRWEAVEGAYAYEVEVASDEDFHAIVLQKKVSTPEVRLGHLAPGTYYLRIAAIDAAGAVGAPSDISTLVIAKREAPPAAQPVALKAPELVAPVDGVDLRIEVLLPVVSFAWRPVAKADAYILQVLDVRGEVAFERRSRGQDANAELKAGDYTWRVKAVRSGAEAEGTWSRPARLRLTHILPQASPVTPVPAPPSATEALPATVAAPLPPPSSVEIQLHHAPSLYRYDAPEVAGGGPEIHIKATLLNSFRLRTTFWLHPRLALALDGRRLATTIFKDAGDSGQAPIAVKPYALQAGLRWRLLGDAGTYVDSRVMGQRRVSPVFSRHVDTPTILSASAPSTQGAVLGLAFGGGSLQVQLEAGRLTGATVASDRLLALSVLYGIPLTTSLRIDLGYAFERRDLSVDGDASVTVSEQALLSGLRLSL